MAPSMKQLIEFSNALSEIMQKDTALLPEEVTIEFSTTHEALQKINEDFFYGTGKSKSKEKLKNDVKEVDVKLNGIRYIYREKINNDKI